MDASGSNILTLIEESFGELSPSQKKIAKFVLGNSDIVSFKTLDDLSKYCDANPSTIVRFCKKLGFEGFPSFQRELQKLLMLKLDRLSHPCIARTYGNFEDPDDIVSTTLKSDMASLNDLANSIDGEEVLNFAEAILRSRKRYLVATRASMGFAHFFYFRLKKILPNVVFVHDLDGGFFDHMADIDREDAVIAISAPRFSAMSMRFIEHVYEKKLATVLSITNDKLSPLYAMSDISLCCPSAPMPFFRSHVATMAVIDLLLSSVFVLNKEESLKRMDEFENVYDNFNLLYERQ